MLLFLFLHSLYSFNCVIVSLQGNREQRWANLQSSFFFLIQISNAWRTLGGRAYNLYLKNKLSLDIQYSPIPMKIKNLWLFLSSIIRIMKIFIINYTAKEKPSYCTFWPWFHLLIICLIWFAREKLSKAKMRLKKRFFSNSFKIYTACWKWNISY